MKNFLIEFANDSTGLGDLIAMMPYVSKFGEVYNYQVIVMLKNKSFSSLFERAYPNLKFIGKGEEIDHDKGMSLKHDLYDMPLQKIFADQLGFKDAEYIRPKVSFDIKERPIKNKFVTFSIQSTFQMKYWNAEGNINNQLISPNWVELCKFLRKKNLTPVCVDYHDNFGIPPLRNHIPSNCVNKTGLSVEDASNYIYHSEFFIGLSSGLSWLAHAMNKKVCMISNFTEDWHEFDLSSDDYIRITNKNVCHGCWNRMNIDYKLNEIDWYSCPRHENTDRQFECHKAIKPIDVIEKINKWII
jgi:autotransporter strand-loop-strand O-heptosyltransferase